MFEYNPEACIPLLFCFFSLDLDSSDVESLSLSFPGSSFTFVFLGDLASLGRGVGDIGFLLSLFSILSARLEGKVVGILLSAFRLGFPPSEATISGGGESLPESLSTVLLLEIFGLATTIVSEASQKLTLRRY